MVTFLITSLFIVAFLAVAVYFWQKPSSATSMQTLPPPLEPRGLFSETGVWESANEAADTKTFKDAAENRASMLERARRGDTSVLRDVNSEFYDEVLNLLVDQMETDANRLALVSYVTRSELPVNSKLAERIIESWKTSPDRSSTAKMLHIAALSDDAALYQAAVEAAMGFWRDGTLADISSEELRSVLDGEFWILSSHTRRSGPGFLLKRALATARRELDAAHSE